MLFCTRPNLLLNSTRTLLLAAYTAAYTYTAAAAAYEHRARVVGQKPHIMQIVADDLGYDDLGHDSIMGNKGQPITFYKHQSKWRNIWIRDVLCSPLAAPVAAPLLLGANPAYSKDVKNLHLCLGSRPLTVAQHQRPHGPGTGVHLQHYCTKYHPTLNVSTPARFAFDSLLGLFRL